MSAFRFSVPGHLNLDSRLWESAHLIGIEGVPWWSRRRFQSGQFTIQREIDESGKLNILWPTQQQGMVSLSTCSLPCGHPPLDLPVELARGTVHRLRWQLDQWHRIGLRLPAEFYAPHEQAVEQFLQSLTFHRDHDQERYQSAMRSIDAALQAIELMGAAYAHQALEARCATEGRLNTLVGFHPRSVTAWEWTRQQASAISLLSIEAHMGHLQTDQGRIDWDRLDQQIAWAQEHDIKVCVGPLVDFASLPRWMLLLEQSAEAVWETACKFAQQCVERFAGRVDLWNCAAGLNATSNLHWDEEDVLRAAVAILETVRTAAPHTPVLMTINEPWAEYLRDDASGISPLHFADALIRADLGLSGLVLETEVGRWPGGTFPRDLLEWHRLVERWALLGLPLMLSVAYDRISPDSIMLWPTSGTSHQESGSETARPTVASRCDSLLRNLVAKPPVHAVVWKEPRACGRAEARTAWAASEPEFSLAVDTFAKLRDQYLE
ncbi:MAG: hypothetical protein KatS3mg111_0651 [Pirellulaceae bacterium]|nr:MAG: hypothetical protein KatS3mg111_0651 [Pirellulaceae bacterium]